ncbi:MAG: aminotransferase class V-fold PLP-dependent enzyme, partial [Verrucomicrobia bacterium]|nr:aminotransferase class V-fold PLP-dependent enzyme [Verrucomicrobiota bacterium]
MEMEERIYLDNNATTQLDPKVLQAMHLELSGPPANPSSAHSFGQRAKGLLSKARSRTAAYFGAKPEEIFFTSGGTEGLNTILRSLKGHVITTAIEHSAVHHTLRASSVELTELPVGLWGAPQPAQVEEAIRPDTAAIVLSAANGETGVKIDLEAMAALCHKRGIPLLIDAVAAIGKEPFTLYPGIASFALSAHKFHGPKGVGLLYLRAPTSFPSLFTGGAQEMGRRAGTENLAGILGLQEALSLLSPQITEKMLALRMYLEQSLTQAIPDTTINGLGPRIANTTNIAFHGVD